MSQKLYFVGQTGRGEICVLDADTHPLKENAEYRATNPKAVAQYLASRFGEGWQQRILWYSPRTPRSREPEEGVSPLLQTHQNVLANAINVCVHSHDDPSKLTPEQRQRIDEGRLW